MTPSCSRLPPGHWTAGSTRIHAGRGGGIASARPGSSRRSCSCLTTNWTHHHDGVAYVFPEPTSVAVSNAAQTGNWQRISKQRPAKPITEKVFTLGIDHGLKPSGAAYAYVVVPGLEADAVNAFAQSIPVRVLANSAVVQAAVHQPNAGFAAVFHEAGVIEGQGWRVSVDRACAIVLRQDHIAVADPTAGTGAITLDVTRPGAMARQLTVTLPSGLHAGASVTMSLD